MSKPRYRPVLTRTVRDTRDEIVRFSRALDAFLVAFNLNPHSVGPIPERAAMLRASMDLTRVLARLRRPGATVTMIEEARPSLDKSETQEEA